MDKVHVVYTYAKEYYSDIKKNKTMPFAATWMGLEIIILNEAKKKKANTIWHYLNVGSKVWHTSMKQTDSKNKLLLAAGVGWGGGQGTWGEGSIGSLGLVDANCYVQMGKQGPTV